MIRPPAVAGTWYPAVAAELTAAVNAHLAGADQHSPQQLPPDADLVALVAPHAGLIYSGPVAAHAYRLLRHRHYEVAVLIGPSHHVGFEGVSVWRRGAFATPLGPLTIDEETASRLIEACPLVHELPAAHGREHSLEMQLPFLAALAPDLPIVPLIMGQQTRETSLTLGDCLAHVLDGRRALLVASSDLSHFFDASTAALLDYQVVAHVEALDEEGLMTRLEERRDHACGGGPIVSVMRAAQALGATTSRVLHYANSGDVSGDRSSVVGYLAAAMWR